MFLLDDAIEVDFGGNAPLAALQWTAQDGSPWRHNGTPAAAENVTSGPEPTQVGMIGELLQGKVLAR